MSLHALANQIQGAGRGPDTTLVHMTPGEVSGLQSLAMAHGGSLSINPETGLPEAGFLSSILPMVAGVALNAIAPGAGLAVGGALGMGGAAGTGLLIGGATALATGSLQKGLMAGLGAYGGAGLGGSLGIGGAANAASGVNAAQAAANSQIGQTMAGTGSSVLPPAAGTAFTNPTVGLPTAPTIPTAPPAQAPVGIQQTNQDIIKTLQAQQPNYTPQAPVQDVAAANMENARQVQQMQQMQQQQMQQQAEAARQAASRVSSVGDATSTAAASTQANQPSFINKMGSLFSSGKKEGEKSAVGSFLDDNKYYLGAIGASALLSPEEKKKKAAEQAAMGYDPSYQAYRTPVTTAPNGPNAELRYFADGGIASLTNFTTPIGDNERYPMAKQFSSVHAQPNSQNPQPSAAGVPGADDVNPYTGETRFAKGGKVSPASSSGGGLGGIAVAAANKKKEEEAEEKKGFMPKYESYNSKTGQFVETGTREREEAERKKKEEYTKATRADFGDFAKEYGGDYNKKQKVTADMMNKAYQRAHGRDATPQEIKNVSKSTMSMAQIMNNLSTHQGAIDRYNEQAQGTFNQKRDEVKAVEAETNRASKGDIAASYYQMFGKPPDQGMLDRLYETKKSPQDIRGEMMKTDEYQKMLTTPAAPKMTRDASGRVSVEGALSPYRSPTEQLGLTEYYKNFNAQMANQPQINRRSVAPAAQQNLSALEPSAPPQGFNNNVPMGPPRMGGFGGGFGGRFGGQQGFVARPGAPMPGMGQQLGGNVYSGGTYQAQYAAGGDVYAGGGISNLGSYSDGGRLLKGPGDGVSDSIPAQIGRKQPARLADGEFVIPARIVSELGNGSTEAGARELYKMMDRVQRGRKKTVGKGKVATDARARKHLPA